MDVVVEDLGIFIVDVFKFLEQIKYLNMKVLEFGLVEWDNMYYFRNYFENLVVYMGIYDNMLIVEWYENLN